MLDGGTLDGATIHVTSPSAGASTSSAAAASPVVPSSAAAGEEVAQEDKPKAAIAAEYLAHGKPGSLTCCLWSAEADGDLVRYRIRARR